ncbi:MAG: hypothetical protein U0835_17225 [Isosphaeraceae bacterium]
MPSYEDILPETTRHHYVPPRHNVLLLSCMDPRLIDDLSNFMHRDNLTNRFDHVILAGACLGVTQEQFPHWRETFFEHLGLAVALHDIQEIYLVEHRSCGAYAHFLGLEYGDSQEEQLREEADHLRQALALRDEIHRWAEDKKRKSGEPVKLRVYSFLMDLRGSTKLIAGPDDAPAPAPAAQAKASKKKTSRR